MSFRTWTTLILGSLVILVGYLFYVQNSLRLVDLSLDLYFTAWKLSSPVPVSALAYASFGTGLLLGLVLLALPWRRATRRVTDLEERLARSGSAPPSGGDLWT